MSTASPDTAASPVHAQIAGLLAEHPIVLFMKGNRRMPQCGFSHQVVEVLDALGVPFFDVDVLANPDIRQGVKTYADWPTVPQLYIKGEFIGGCDIIRQMYATGELQKKVGSGS